MNILRGDMKGIFGRDKAQEKAEWDKTLDKYIEDSGKPFQTHCDVLVIGGGGIGSSIAYWLKKEAREGLNVVVVEKDPMVSGYFLIDKMMNKITELLRSKSNLISLNLLSTKKPPPVSA